MANSAHSTSIDSFQKQIGRVGKQETVRAVVTLGSDYAAAKLPLFTADEFGLNNITGVIIKDGSSNVGHNVVPSLAADGGTFTLTLYNGTTAIGTVDESATTVALIVLGTGA